MTSDAVEEYKPFLTDTGMIMFHITNRHLFLRFVQMSSTWAVLARTEDEAAQFDHVMVSHPLEAPSDQPLWTDDHSDIISVIRW